MNAERIGNGSDAPSKPSQFEMELNLLEHYEAADNYGLDAHQRRWRVMGRPRAKVIVNNVGWVVGVEVFADGEWQPADYDMSNVYTEDDLTESYAPYDDGYNASRTEGLL